MLMLIGNILVIVQISPDCTKHTYRWFPVFRRLKFLSHYLLEPYTPHSHKETHYSTVQITEQSN